MMVVHPHPLVRMGIAAALDCDILEPKSELQALDWAESYRPDAAVVEPLWLNLTAQLSRRDIPVVILTSSTDEALVLKSLAQGAAMFLHISEPVSAIRAAIIGTVNGSLRLHAATVRKVVRNLLAERQSNLRAATRLSPRELEVMELVAQGLRNSEIAGKLGIYLGTVKNYTSRAYEKLGVEGRAQAIIKMLQSGILEKEDSGDGKVY